MFSTLAAFVARVCPDLCPRCRVAAAPGFCRACLADFVRIERACPDCGLPRPCRPCPARAPGWQLDGLRSPFAYLPPLSRYIQGLKYRRDRWLGRSLGDLLAMALAAGPLEVDALVAMPLHRKRLCQRTYNQADELAERVAAHSGLSLLTANIRRARNNLPQTELGRAERMRLDRNVFVVARDLTGLRLAVIDDVATTCASLNALAGALRVAGARHVEALVLARSIGRRRDQPERNR